MQGLGNLPMSARWAVLIGALLGLAFEGVRLATKGRFWLSGVGIGLATVIPFNTCFAMFLGTRFFWAAERFWSKTESAGNRISASGLILASRSSIAALPHCVGCSLNVDPRISRPARAAGPTARAVSESPPA